MLHHISLPVSNLGAARTLYDAALSPLGYRCVFSDATAVGYGVEDGKGKLCLKLRPDARDAGDGFHLALTAPSQRAVDEFHAAAMKSGAVDCGGPGLRSHYGPDHYAAFVADLDGHRLEAVHK